MSVSSSMYHPRYPNKCGTARLGVIENNRCVRNDEDDEVSCVVSVPRGLVKSLVSSCRLHRGG
eukprot:3723356-Prorocentrum_lima.AAC.1